MSDSNRPLALVTGASSGIGYELARLIPHMLAKLTLAADCAAVLTDAGIEDEVCRRARYRPDGWLSLCAPLR